MGHVELRRYLVPVSDGSCWALSIMHNHTSCGFVLIDECDAGGVLIENELEELHGAATAIKTLMAVLSDFEVKEETDGKPTQKDQRLP